MEQDRGKGAGETYAPLQILTELEAKLGPSKDLELLPSKDLLPALYRYGTMFAKNIRSSKVFLVKILTYLSN